MRRRTYRSPMPPAPRRRPTAIAIAARPTFSLWAVALLALALLLSLLLPRLAAASEARPAVELGDGVARVHVETNADAAVVVEWGLAPNLSKVARSSGGTVHDLALQGLEPGRIYVYRVVVDGIVVTPPTPFRTAGEVPAPQPLRA